jgi:PAS domain S-box-containing protein
MEGDRFVDCNRRAEELFGASRQRIVGNTPYRFSPRLQPDGRVSQVAAQEKIKRVIEEGAHVFEWTHCRLDGATFESEVSLSLLEHTKNHYVLALIRDITERKRSAGLILQSERLKAVGELSSGVSHNFNNMLQIVLGNAHLGMTNLELGAYADVKANLQEIADTSKFASETVRRLQYFARNRSTAAADTCFDLSGTAGQAIEMSRIWWKTAPEKHGVSIDLEARLEPDCFVAGRENELFEVIVNLIKNAAEALPQGGLITVSSRWENDVVTLDIADNGIGISEADQKRVFEPFFTTKGYQSTGMGLASCHGIVRSHSGTMTVLSSPGEGTTFTMMLPFASPRDKQGRSEEPISLGRVLSILVIDDMEPVLTMIGNGLKTHGQTVHAALSGEEGLRLFAREPIDIVVCDLGMSGMNGWAVGKAIKSQCEAEGRPKPPFIILTGWGDQAQEQARLAEAAVDAVLEKPVDLPLLVKKIRDLAGGGEASGSRETVEMGTK